jgi:hypothetical protein
MVSDYPELQVKVGKKGYGYRQIAQTIEEYNEYSAPKGAFLGMN